MAARCEALKGMAEGMAIRLPQIKEFFNVGITHERLARARVTLSGPGAGEAGTAFSGLSERAVTCVGRHRRRACSTASGMARRSAFFAHARSTGRAL